MEPAETVKYLQIIEDYLRESWLKNRDPETRAEVERIAAEIVELKKNYD
jgi:hypothetical protein